ncbi:DNA-(apurinic or apyrimidinic site) lyase 1 [Penicillium diatomitis]|uniref:Apurinic-apyrimidinic endonuclease 1 n=1 Tax=Penicillium diatomitis TaxID=2819901 RepID=A0A9X0BYQ4_9EURO|nr:DNA-(apurinic or apyrimidinic site) lyase 1 [Penicillium diatomitis]KAJ5489462.1 DNA-(apurinic or apyrimidinic site) lyase 1 [Penicillium diatomitis]
MSSTPAKASHKRNLSNGASDSFPLRRSKRQRPATNIEEPSSDDGSGVDEAEAVSQSKRSLLSRTRASKTSKGKAQDAAPLVKDERIEDQAAPLGKAAPKKKAAQKFQADAIEVKGETGIETIVVKKPVKKTRKTKEEKELDAMPLASRTQGLKMFVGAHVSAAKARILGITPFPRRSDVIEAHNLMNRGNAFALFLKSQRKWDNPPLQDDVRDQFRKMCEEQKYDQAKHVLPHGSYLVNLAQNDKTKANQAYDSFLDDLRRCEALGIRLYNFHPGSTNQTPLPEALARLADALTRAISETSTVIPVLETMCGHGNTIGGSLSEFRDLLALIPEEHHSRIGICIDTCHSFAAGYDLVTPEGFKAFLAEFEELIGIKFLRALHLNDSKAPRGSHRDLHANIGTGFLGLRAFHNVMNEPRFEGLPMVLETPIDRVPGQTGGDGEGDKCDSCTSETEKKVKKKIGKQGAKRPAGASPAAVPDHAVWAREIKLLESLIGMDPEGEEFRTLEARLSEEGRPMREKQMEQYERKLETERRKDAKAKEKGQKSLVEMMKKTSKE